MTTTITITCGSFGVGLHLTDGSSGMNEATAIMRKILMEPGWLQVFCASGISILASIRVGDQLIISIAPPFSATAMTSTCSSLFASNPALRADIDPPHRHPGLVGGTPIAELGTHRATLGIPMPSGVSESPLVHKFP